MRSQFAPSRLAFRPASSAKRTSMLVGTKDTAATIDKVSVSAYRIPTNLPEADGTYAWDSTTIVIVEAAAADQTGIGYSYADAATARLIETSLVETLRGKSAGDIPAAWTAMVQAIRNL